MEEKKKIQIQNFINEFESYIKKFSEKKEVNNEHKAELIIDGKPHSTHIANALQNLENIYKELNPEKNDTKVINEFIKDKILLPQNLFFYEDKKQFMKLILDKNINNPSKVNFVEELLKRIENNNKIIFSQKDDYKFYEYLLLKIYNLSGTLEYTENEMIIINKCDIKILNSIHIKNFFEIFLHQTNLEIIKEMSHLLYQINNFDYKQEKENNPLNKLIESIKTYIMNINFPCMKLLEYIIEQKEKSHLIKTKSHKLLCKREMVKIIITKEKRENNEKNKRNEDSFYFYENTTIFEILNYFKEKNDNFLYQILNGENIIEKKDYNKTLREITKDKKQITIIQKEIKKEKLFENGNLTEKFNKFLKTIFNQFSSGKGYLINEEIRKYVSILMNKKIELHNMKIIDLFKRYSSDIPKRSLKENEFIKIYIARLNKGTDQDEKVVLDNLHDLGYNFNLEKKEIFNVLENDKNMRYYLSNKINGEKTFLDELKEKYKETNDINLLNFILFLSTNIESYFNLLEIDFSQQENKFTSKAKNYIDNMYDLIIIESIIEDLKINYLKNEEEYKNKIFENKYSPFVQEGIEEKKKIFFINFIKNSYNRIYIFFISKFE